MEWYQRLAGAVGLFAMVGGLALLFVPSVVTVGPVDGLQKSIAVAGTERVLLLAGTVIACYLGVTVRRTPTRDDLTPQRQRFDRAESHPPESVTVSRERLVATRLDADIDAAIEAGGPALRVVRTQLRWTVIAVYTDRHGTTEQTAREAVDQGEWCHDRVANSFLAADGRATPTLGDRLRLFAVPERERRRRIERTIGAIERIEQP